jgi:hypothetical protein
MSSLSVEHESVSETHMIELSAILFRPGKTLSCQKENIMLNLCYYLAHMSTTIIFEDIGKFNMSISLKGK